MDDTLRTHILRAAELRGRPGDAAAAELANIVQCLEETLDFVRSCGGQARSIVSHQLESMLPAQIHYVQDLDQYAINIEGTVLRGNIGTIYTRREDDHLHTTPCRSGRACQKIGERKPCKFYHDPLHGGPCRRNFHQMSWVYSTKKNDAHVRHFGNGPTLDEDVLALRAAGKLDAELERFEAQVMHDILVLCRIKKAAVYLDILH